MQKINNQTFNHLKIHTQYSICEGAIKIDDLSKYCKEKFCIDKAENNQKDYCTEVSVSSDESC